MLSIEEIKQFINEDNTSEQKRLARQGQAYYEGEHDIKDYKLFYYNADGELVEDKSRSNIKIPHPFLTELIDQATQYILSGKDGIIKSDIPELQTEMDAYFNENEDFMAELSEVLTGCQAKGSDFMYAYRDEAGKLAFQCADFLGVKEVRAKDTDTKVEHIIYRYPDRVEKGTKIIWRIQVWDAEQVAYYVQEDEGEIIPDDSEPINPKPHTLYKKDGDEQTYCDSFGFIPFFRLDNNKKQTSCLKPIKALIDDYDLMASSLSNNLVDFDTPIHIIKGVEGDDMDKVQKNIKTKKLIAMEATEAGAGLDIKTVDVPYQARKEKLELDEKNIYRFGMGLNMEGLKDTTATTNIAIKAMYALLDLKCSKLIIKLKQFLRKIIKIVLDEINKENKTDYQLKDIYFEFEPEVMSNAQENAQIELTEAQRKQIEINILLGLATYLDNELLMQLVAEQLDLDWEEIKGKVINPDEAEEELNGAQSTLGAIPVEETV